MTRNKRFIVPRDLDEGDLFEEKDDQGEKRTKKVVGKEVTEEGIIIVKSVTVDREAIKKAPVIDEKTAPEKDGFFKRAWKKVTFQ